MNEQQKLILEEVLSTLNEAATADPVAMKALVDNRVECSWDLVRHPTIQVEVTDPPMARVGMLGILNGIVERLTGERVMAIFDVKDQADPSQVLSQTLRFDIYQKS